MSTRTRSWLQPNPILVKEVRAQLRGGRAFLLLTGLLLGLVVAGYGLFLIATSRERFGAPILSALIGQTLFGGLAFTLLAGACIIAPAVTVSAISSEKERLTYEMLITTRLSPRRILWGKLLASFSYVALMLLAAAPLGSIVYIFGGIELQVVLQVLAVVVVTALVAGLLGLCASALFGRTGRAAIATYLVLGLIMGGLLLSVQIWERRSGDEVPLGLLTPNPVTAIASQLAPMGSNGMARNPIEFEMLSARSPWGGGAVSGGISDIPGWSYLSSGLYPRDWNNPIMPEPRSTWRTTLVIEIMAGLVLFWIALHAVRPRRRWLPMVDDLIMIGVSSFTLLGLGWWLGWWL